MIKRIFRLFLVVIISTMVVWWLNVPLLDTDNDSGPVIVTTTPILQDLIQQLVGPDIAVTSLIKRDDNPLTVTYDSQQERLIKRANIIVVNGSLVDGPYQNIASLKNDTADVISINDYLKRNKQHKNPYFWMNILTWNNVAHFAHVKLVRALPKKKSEIEYRAKAYRTQIYEHYKLIRSRIEKNKQRLVTNHPSLIPFAELFQLPITVLDTSQEEEAVRDLQQLYDLNNVLYFYPNESLGEDNYNNVIDKAVKGGVNIAILPPILTLNLSHEGTGRSTYLDIMLVIAQAINNG